MPVSPRTPPRRTKSNWMGTHPAKLLSARSQSHAARLAYASGWHPGDGLFEWLAPSGEVMVKSVWWIDGNLGHVPPHLHDEVGEGWLVVASLSAFEKIKTVAGAFERRLVVTRSARISDVKLERTFSNSEAI